jgi:hypothetical protein
MPETKTPAPPKKKAAPKKADVATTEDVVTTRTLEYDGLVIDGLPAKLPFRVMRGMYEVRQIMRTGGNDPSGILDLIAGVIGEQAMERFFEHFGDRDMEDAGEILNGMVEAVFELYGTSTGESSASPKS